MVQDRRSSNIRMPSWVSVSYWEMLKQLAELLAAEGVSDIIAGDADCWHASVQVHISGDPPD